MVGKLKYILIALIIWLIPNVAHADCNYEREAELSRIASNVQFSYEYEINEGGSPNFTVLITNLTDDIYIEDQYGMAFRGIGEKTQGYTNGDEPVFTIYSNDSACYGEELLTKHLNLPAFNEFSNYAGCVHYPDFKYCTMWANTTDITSEQFYKELKAYTDNEGQKKDAEKVNKIDTVDVLKAFANDNLGTIILCIVAIVILILAMVIKKISKKR